MKTSTQLFSIIALMMFLGVSTRNVFAGPDHHVEEVFCGPDGYYHWERVAEDVWIPGSVIITRHGTRFIPGHWEVRMREFRCFDRRHFRVCEESYYGGYRDDCRSGHGRYNNHGRGHGYGHHREGKDQRDDDRTDGREYGPRKGRR